MVGQLTRRRRAEQDGQNWNKKVKRARKIKKTRRVAQGGVQMENEGA